jgi:uncharacterized protein (DUF58 family)
LFPARRLLAAVALWTAAAFLVVVAPMLWLPALVALLLLLAWAWWDAALLRRMAAPQVRRLLPDRAAMGRRVRIAIEISNAAVRPVTVSLIDEPPDDLHDGDVRLDGIRVEAGGVERREYTVLPRQRGDRSFGPLICFAWSPLGLWRRRDILPAGQVLRVFPDTAHLLRREALDPKRLFASLGIRPVRHRGEGMELESLRDYVPGDDPRHLDWAASARRGRPVTRVYQHERNHTVWIVLDTSRLMAARVDGRSKLDCAIDAALALAYAGLLSGDRVAVSAFAARVQAHLAPRRHRREMGQVIDLLRDMQPSPVEPDYRALVRHLLAAGGQQALVVVLTDFVEATTAALIEPLLVLARSHRVLLVAIRDRVYGELALGAGENGAELYRRIVIAELASEREAALARLRRNGLQTLDLVPEGLTAEVVNRYLAIRYGPER